MTHCPFDREELTFRSSIILKASTVKELVEHDIDFLRESAQKPGMRREVLDEGDTSTLERQRVLYQHNEMPTPFPDNDAVIADKTELLGENEAILYGCVGTWVDKPEIEKVFRNCGFTYGAHYKDCTPPGSNIPLVRLTDVMCMNPSGTGGETGRGAKAASCVTLLCAISDPPLLVALLLA